MENLRACFRRIDITPQQPTSLLGYFNDRVSTGILDRLHCRITALYGEGAPLLFVQVDTCLIPSHDVEVLKAAISRACGIAAERIMVFASHTHTAPALANFYAVKRESGYVDGLIASIAQACKALQPETHVRMRVCRGMAPGLASNRRWFLAGGAVATNPPRMHPTLDRPEGPVDDQVNTVAFVAPDGKMPAMFVSISNHTDTIGGTEISADWPAAMEAEIRAARGEGTMVVPVIGAAGNINHFDFHHKLEQTSPDESRRIGHAYAAAVIESLDRGTTMETQGLRAAAESIGVAGIEVTEAELKRAKDLVAQPDAELEGKRDLTAEDIFAGDPAVQRVFAGALLRLVEERPAEYCVPLQVFRVGSVGFFAVPGEPFVEIGLALKKLSGFDLSVPVGLANGYFGYIPLPECFPRGGYEVKPGPALLSRQAASILLGALTRMAGRLG
jgi:neutral ceramidase